jgi:hypothetical protein
MARFDRVAWIDLSRWLRSGGGGRLQANGQPRAAFQAAAHGAKRRRLAGRLTDGGQQGLLATKCDGKSTKTKRRTRGNHLGARKGGRSAGEADRSEDRAPVGRSGGGVVEEWRSSGERCGLERELGASYIGPRE